MRVGFLTSTYPQSESDPRGSHVHGLARSLRELGVEVQVATIGSHNRKLAIDGVAVQVHRYGSLGQPDRLSSEMGGILPALGRHPSRALQLPGLTLALVRAARSLARSSDLIHAHWMIPSGWVAVRFQNRVPVLVTAHGSDVAIAERSLAAKRLSESVVRKAAAVTCVSEALIPSISDLGVDTTSVHHTPLGVELADGVNESERYRFIYVGALTANKSVETILDAVSDLAGFQGEFEVWIVGDGPERSALERRARGLPAGLVKFKGAKSHVEALQAIAASDCLVLPSLFEGKGLVALEAMAAGVPVLGSRVGGIPESVVDGATGYLFDPKDSTHLSELMGSMLSNPDLTASLGSAARIRVEALGLTGLAAAERFKNVYRSIVGGP